MAITSASNLEIGFSKWKTQQLCERNGVPAPLTFTPNSLDDLSRLANDLVYPVVIKPRIGNSAKGVIIVYDAEHFLQSYKSLLDQYGFVDDHWPIVQEYLGKDLHGVCMIYENGELRASFCEQYLRCKQEDMFGTSTYRISTYVREHIVTCKRLADSLGWHGVLHFDILVDPNTGVGKIIEMNPRFWGALNLAIVSGVDFPYMLYQLALTGEIDSVASAYRTNVTSRWVVGDLIALVDALAGNGNVQSKLRRIRDIIMTPVFASTDDFRLSDPATFLFEMADYASRYLGSGSRNPVTEGMIR